VLPSCALISTVTPPLLLFEPNATLVERRSYEAKRLLKGCSIRWRRLALRERRRHRAPSSCAVAD
jgi:hypothetical protein